MRVKLSSAMMLNKRSHEGKVNIRRTVLSGQTLPSAQLGDYPADLQGIHHFLGELLGRPADRLQTNLRVVGAS